MKLLLDTQAFLWFISGDERLSEASRDAIRDSANEVYLSVVSLWEAMVKYQLSKLPLPESPESYLPIQRQRHQIASLPLDEISVSKLADLPPIHRDPFDRMIICQALAYDLTIVTTDDTVAKYPVTMLAAGCDRMIEVWIQRIVTVSRRWHRLHHAASEPLSDSNFW